MLRKVSCLLYFTLILLIAIYFFPCNVKAAEKSAVIKCTTYRCDENGRYDVSSSEILGSGGALCKFSASGNILKTTEKSGIPAFEVAIDSNLTFSYTYDNTLVNADATEEHLISDNGKSVNGVELNAAIQKGVIILETSLDGEKWTVAKQRQVTNAFEDLFVEEQRFCSTNAIELTNGCYYRITVAYETEKELEESQFIFKKYERKKYAEIFEFYASYKETEKTVDLTNMNKFTLGETIKTGTDNGYFGKEDIDKNDPHYNWVLGNFFVSGYTDKTDDNIFLKNVGDRVSLYFNLKEDIDKLNGEENLSISEDINGYDQNFQTKQTNMGRGTLIIRYTDQEGVKSDPIIYENYLQSLTSAGADTKVQLFEEGDYEVALDYEIKKDGFLPSYSNYRISFAFKVRNGNCMVYPRDIVTQSELAESSVTPNGFYIDLAESYYLKPYIQMTRWTKGVNGYVEDIRLNTVANDGDKFEEEGIYTITVVNPTTNLTTEKKIYVGSDSVLIAHMNVENSSYTVNEIANLVEQGAQIKDDGTIVMPTSYEPEGETSETTTLSDTTADKTEISTASDINSAVNSVESEVNNVIVAVLFAVIVVVVIVVAAIAVLVLKKRKK